MTCVTIIKPIENPSGVGEVFDKDRLVARVRYNLDVLEEEPLDNRSQEYSTIGRLESTIGIITVIEKGRKLRRLNSLTLHLHDRRKLDFCCQKTDPAQPRYSIVSKGKFY